MENMNLEQQKYIRAKKKVKSVKGFYVHLVVYVLVNLFLLISQAISDQDWGVLGEWQTYNTVFFWGIGIVFHAFNVFGLDFILGKSWEDKKIKELMDKDKTNLQE